MGGGPGSLDLDLQNERETPVIIKLIKWGVGIVGRWLRKENQYMTNRGNDLEITMELKVTGKGQGKSEGNKLWHEMNKGVEWHSPVYLRSIVLERILEIFKFYLQNHIN